MRGVSGSVQRGQMCAIMGASGSGKTTLLDILYGTAKVGHKEGLIFVNGEPITSLSRLAGYVPQEDTLLSRLSVREHLLYGAELRLPETMPRLQKEARVDKVISDLGLDNVRNSLIGGAGASRGLSGGERKRVSIAMELLTAKSILLCDEPTSGLDAHNSYLVMEALSKLAKSGWTVLCVLHQVGK